MFAVSILVERCSGRVELALGLCGIATLVRALQLDSRADVCQRSAVFEEFGQDGVAA